MVLNHLTCGQLAALMNSAATRSAVQRQHLYWSFDGITVSSAGYVRYDEYDPQRQENGLVAVANYDRHA